MGKVFYDFNCLLTCKKLHPYLIILNYRQGLGERKKRSKQIDLKCTTFTILKVNIAITNEILKACLVLLLIQQKIQLIHSSQHLILFTISDEAKERDAARHLAGEMKRRIEKQAKKKRERMDFEETDVSSINKRNKRFNQKISRNFDKHTAEIRQNLERGTAL